VADDGGIINDPVLLKLGENHFWLSLADSDVLLWARGLAHGLRLDVNIIEPDVSPLAIQGPRADEVAARLLGDWVRDLRFFGFRELELDGIPLLVARSGWSKQGGVELYLRNGRLGDELWERVAAAGKPFDIAPAAPSTIERIESGLLSWGNDMTLANNPFEVGLGHYCDLEQEAEFVGKTALRRIRAEGVRQKLVGVVIGDEEQPGTEHWWPLTDDSGAPAGEVRSATYSPRLKQMIGLAMVSIDKTAVGTLLTVHAPWDTATATVAEVPFVG
jgi:aminomethyltransferase